MADSLHPWRLQITFPVSRLQEDEAGTFVISPFDGGFPPDRSIRSPTASRNVYIPDIRVKETSSATSNRRNPEKDG